MDLDVDISRWVLEFLLRDRHNETLAKRLLAVAPLPNHHDWRLKKTVLLRTIESAIYDDGSVTEAILEALESIEALDRGQGFQTTEAMRAAYCAVATECTVKFLVCFGRKYIEAVDRIWRGRVRVLEESERSELVSAELKERRYEVEAAIWDRNVSRKLARMNTRNDALRLVGEYVEEAWAVIGPPFLNWAVRFHMVKESLGDGDGNVGDGCGKEVRMVNGNELEVQVANGADLGDGSKLEVNGANEGDGSKPEVQIESDTKVGHGSELVIWTGVEVPLTNGADLGVGKELNGQRENGANVSDGSGVKARRVNGANVGGDRSKWEARRVENDTNVGDVTVAFSKFGSLLGYHSMDGVLRVVGEGRSPLNVNCGVLSFEPATKEKEIPRNMALRHKHGPLKIRDAEYVGTDASDGIHNYVSSTEVREVQEELKSSVMALQSVVTDPLPYNLRVPEIVRSELEVNHVSGEDGTENPSVEMNTGADHSNSDTNGNPTSSDQNDVPQAPGKENDASNLSVEKGKGTEYVRSGDPNRADLCCSNQNSGPRPGLMERNSTAHAYKWDDSLGMSPEGTSNGKGTLHLPTLKRNAISPLKKYEDKRFAKRRKVKRWSIHEEDMLRAGVQEYGKGNWKLILDAYRDVFEERTEVDLKDKWRNMSK
ncbi:hypothetical protein ABKV19_013597 [Rosa sericea]